MSEREYSVQSRNCYDQLHRLLILTQIRPGSRLVESEWAKRLNVHRTSLREALSMLAHEGLLRRGERGGYFVPVLEQRDIDEVWTVRAIVEASAIRLMAQRPEPDVNVDRLDELVDLMERMLSSNFEMGFLEADRLFHETLVEMSGNHRLLQVYKLAPLPLGPSLLPDAAARYEECVVTIREHREIAKLVRERQVQEAIDHLEKHLRNAHRPVPSY